MVVADECKVQQEPNATCRWSQRGDTPVIPVKRDTRNHISIYGGLSLRLKQVFTHFCHWQNGAETILFLEVIKRYWMTQTITKKKILLVWDNASWHKGKLVKDWLIRNPGVVELMNLPPYHPEFNPQEHVWKTLKQYLARLKRNEQSDFKTIVKRTRYFLKNRVFDYSFL